MPWPQPLVNQSYCHAGGTGLYFPPPAPEAQACPPEPEHPCSTGQELSQARRQRQAAGAPRGRRETDTSGTVQQVSLCVSQCKRCWGLLWPQHSSGSVQCWGTPGSEPSLPAAPIEAEAVGTGSTLQPAAGQETPQGGARAQVAAAAKVEALSAWPAPGAPGHLDRATGESISVAPNSKFQAFLGVFLGSPDSTCLCPWAPFPLGSGAFLDIWRKRVTRPRPGQLPFRSPREWAGAGPEGRGTFWKVGTGRRFSAERARSNLGEGQWARRKRQASEQSPGERERESGWNGRCRKGQAALPYPPPPGHQQCA